MGHVSMKERRARKAERELHARIHRGMPVSFWVLIRSHQFEIVDGVLFGLAGDRAEMGFLGGYEIRSLKDFVAEPSKDIKAWWPTE
jgi:hypothetical protein